MQDVQLDCLPWRNLQAEVAILVQGTNGQCSRMKECAGQTRLIMIGRGSAYLPKLPPSFMRCLSRVSDTEWETRLPKIIRCQNYPVEAQLPWKSPIAQRYRSILSWSRIKRRCTCALGIALSTEDFLSKRCVDINIGITAPVATPKRINNQTTP